MVNGFHGASLQGRVSQGIGGIPVGFGVMCVDFPGKLLGQFGLEAKHFVAKDGGIDKLHPFGRLLHLLL